MLVPPASTIASILFSAISRPAFSIRARRSSSVMGFMPSVIGRSLRIDSGTPADCACATCVRPAAADAPKNALRWIFILLFLPEKPVGFRQRGLLLFCRLGNFQSQPFNSFGQDFRNQPTRHPLMVGRQDVPGSMAGAGCAQCILIGFDVLVPVCALGQIG